MNKLEVRHIENVEAFDRVTLNADHLLEYSGGDLTAAWPAGEDVRAFQVALFPVSEGAVELPDGAAVLSVSESVVALVPTDEYGGDN